MGGSGSGDFGHAGIPGHQGGSSAGGGDLTGKKSHERLNHPGSTGKGDLIDNHAIEKAKRQRKYLYKLR
jgi:hypothetical protein